MIEVNKANVFLHYFSNPPDFDISQNKFSNRLGWRILQNRFSCLPDLNNQQKTISLHFLMLGFGILLCTLSNLPDFHNLPQKLLGRLGKRS